MGKTKQKTEEQIRRGKDNRLRKTYGISMSEYEQMLSRKELGCWICGEPAKTVSLSVDHDHSCCPGKQSCGKCVRGLLCSQCNIALGYLDDDPVRMGALIAYIKATNQ